MTLRLTLGLLHTLAALRLRLLALDLLRTRGLLAALYALLPLCVFLTLHTV